MMKRGLIAGADPSVVAALQVMLYGQVCIDSLREGSGAELLGAVSRRTYDWVMVEESGNSHLDRDALAALASRTHVIVVSSHDREAATGLESQAIYLEKDARLSERLKTVQQVTVH
ncbi:MAG: hypothetical protein KIT79_02515 [Deltaproteobacteria bacterium]|nr:hypothetical protein [Deltaproteobacteria bacterium]